MDIWDEAIGHGRTVVDMAVNWADALDRQPTANIVVILSIVALVILAIVLALYLRHPQQARDERPATAEAETQVAPIVIERLPAPYELRVPVDESLSRLDTLENAVASLQEGLEEQGARLQKLRTALLSIEGGMKSLSGRLEKDRGNNAPLESELASLRATIGELQQKVNKARSMELAARRLMPPRQREKISAQIVELVQELDSA